jgi:hypothetical protein
MVAFDIQEIQELELPLFTRGNSILGSNTFTKASQLNVPLHFWGELWEKTGDILAGDSDGVVVISPSLVEQVVLSDHKYRQHLSYASRRTDRSARAAHWSQRRSCAQTKTPEFARM